jgi:hypothetical protein
LEKVYNALTSCTEAIDLVSDYVSLEYLNSIEKTDNFDEGMRGRRER